MAAAPSMAASSRPAWAETEIIRADDRDQAQVRPAEQVEDDCDPAEADQPLFAFDQGERTEDVLEQGTRTIGRGRITVANSGGGQDGDEVHDRAERKAALDAPANGIAPPIAGPAMRLALLEPTSKIMAWPMRSAPTTRPIMRRRSGKSVDQIVPEIRLATARCQIAR